MALPPYAAIVLAGGRGARLGGVHKPGVRVAGRTLLERVLAAVEGAQRTVVVGPPQPVPAGISVACEEPPGGGPVAALAAGLAALGDSVPFVAVLAADLPFLTPDAVTALRFAATDRDGALLVDTGGRDQQLAAVWRTESLTGAFAELGDPAGAAMRRLIGGLDAARVAPTGGPHTPPAWFDCDDPDDLTAAERWAMPT